MDTGPHLVPVVSIMAACARAVINAGSSLLCLATTLVGRRVSVVCHVGISIW